MWIENDCNKLFIPQPLNVQLNQIFSPVPHWPYKSLLLSEYDTWYELRPSGGWVRRDRRSDRERERRKKRI